MLIYIHIHIELSGYSFCLSVLRGIKLLYGHKSLQGMIRFVHCLEVSIGSNHDTIYRCGLWYDYFVLISSSFIINFDSIVSLHVFYINPDMMYIILMLPHTTCANTFIIIIYKFIS